MIAITNRVSPKLAQCELTFHQRTPIDIDLADRQHGAYCDLLEAHGLQVVRLEINREFPDSVFVEDTAVVVDECAVIATMGAESRRGEVEAMAEVLGKYRPFHRIPDPARIEGGDVLRAGKKVWAGLSTRTDAAGIDALSRILSPHGYTVEAVPMKKALHLKSAVTALDDETLIINRDAVDPAPFAGFRLVDIPESEPGAACVLRLPDGHILLHAGFDKTIQKLESIGYKTAPVDISELIKAESGVTCSSIIFSK